MNLRTLGKNACFYAAGTIGVRTASFLLIPLYTHTLSTADYGLLAVLLQTAQIMMIVIGMGSRTALLRFARDYEDRGRSGILLGTTVVINLFGALVVTVIASLASPLFKGVLHSERVLGYVLLTCAGAFLNCLSIHLLAYYRAGHEGLKVTVANLFSAVLLMILSLVFLRIFHLGIQGALLAQVLIYGALDAFVLAMISMRIRFGFSLPLMKDLMRFGLPLILVSAGGLATQASALYCISYFSGLEAAGIYSLGMKMAQIAEMVLILPFAMAYEPFIYGHSGGSELSTAVSRILTYLMTAFAFVACGIMFAARGLLPVMAPPAFHPAYFVIFLALPAVGFRGIYYIGESLLYLEKKTNLVAGVVVAFTVLGVVLNYVMVWRWGLYGAVAVYIITTVAAGATVMMLALTRTVVRMEWDRLFVAAALLFGFMAAVYALRGTASYAYYSLVPACVCAGTLLLYTTSFIREDEKRAIQAFFSRIQSFRSVLDS